MCAVVLTLPSAGEAARFDARTGKRNLFLSLEIEKEVYFRIY